MTDTGDRVAAATAWRDADPDPATRDDLSALLADPARADELDALFAGRLQFGTAGLRGALGPGPLRMNRVLVALAAAGLGRYLDDQGLRGAGPVVIGWDARHHSDVFARDTAELLAGAGFEVLLFDRHLPTPLVPFTIRARGCIAGVMVTASHNPPADNGYKVYLGDGSQIIPPADADIAAAIDSVAVAAVPELPRSESYTLVGEELIEAYLERAVSSLPADPARGEVSLDARGPDHRPAVRWVHTALHGVGADLMRRAAVAAGFDPPLEVATQRDPDPDFPTVAFPNPEEPGAIDAAIALAEQEDADLVIANDPDADRCAVAIPTTDGWRMLTGDEVGNLLGEWKLDHTSGGVVASSVVSSTQLRDMARAAGREHVTTLTGFKWIGRVPGLVFGYEEALGYCCDPQAVPDKDGITAGLNILAIAMHQRIFNNSPLDSVIQWLDGAGVYRTTQLSIRVESLDQIVAMMSGLRADPPDRLLGQQVRYCDLLDEGLPGEPGHGLPATDGVVLWNGRLRVVVRPSGTEPKLKCYLQVMAPPGARDVRDDRVDVADELVRLREAMAGILGVPAS